MLSDFCHVLWDTKIESDTVSSDGFEVCNLISRQRAKKQNGFLAACFVKPAISVLISFPFPVELFAVNINPKVGAQSTRGFEIFSACLKPRNVQNVNIADECINDQKMTKNKGCKTVYFKTTYGKEVTTFHSYEYELNINNVKEEFKDYFVQNLKVQIPEGHVGHFVNPCFVSSEIQNVESNILKNEFVKQCSLQHGHFLRCISHLIVKITQVHKGSVPCLGSLEVFARPAQNCGKFVTNYATVINSRLKQERENVCGALFSQIDGLGCSESKSRQVSIIKPVGNRIPEEFLDPITLNIMTLPVLLPSGTTIDQTTLDKHINSEKNWGRFPSDPFTGLPLASNVIPNAALKCRIDKFLLSSNMSVTNLGRAIGSICDQQSTTKLKLNSVETKRITLQSKRPSLAINNIQNFKKQKAEPEVTQNDGINISSGLDLALEKVLSAHTRPIKQTKNISVSSLISAPNLNESEAATTNVKELETNLDQESKVQCQCTHQQHSTLYQLPCKHVICRACLKRVMGTTGNQCPNCHKTFIKNNVIKVHQKYFQR